MNLTMNAIETMAMVTDRERRLVIQSHVSMSGNLEITIEDSGFGINPSEKDRIFDAFYTTKSEGMGMGLFICRSIIEAHGGRLSGIARAITVQSSTSSYRALNDRRVSRISAIVFVVDDDASIRELLSTLFRSVGWGVRTFDTASEFLQSKLPECPSCMVLDVRLPGMSGLDFQTELAKAEIRIPIIFMTGHGDIPMTVQAMKAGAVEFSTKPFRDQDMLDAVQCGLARDRSRRAERGNIKASIKF